MATDNDQQYQRPKDSFRFKLGGLKTNSTPDSMPPDKSPYVSNIRAVSDHSVQTRSGLQQLFPSDFNKRISDIRAYTALLTDNNPRYLFAEQTTNTKIWLGQPGDTSTNVGNLAGTGAAPLPGVSMIPFRPAQSPNPWMYIANGLDYQKFSAPGIADAVTQQAVGIAEPQIAPNAAGIAMQNVVEAGAGAGFVAAGTAGATAGGNRVSDTVQSVFADPGVATGYPTIGVSASKAYAKQMFLTIAGNRALVQDVYPGLTTATAVASIYYFTGSTGRCVVVPAGFGSGPGVSDESIYTQNLLNSIRRGALVKFSSGPETCYIWSVIEGPDGTICFETSTTGTHTTVETMTFPPALQIYNSAAVSAAQAILSPQASFAITAGIGTQTLTASGMFVVGQFSFQEEDYIQFSINVSALASFNEAKLMFDVGDGSFTQNFYYYTVRASDVEASIQNTLTQLGAAQLVSQRAAIDEEKTAASGNQLSTASSAQTTPGDAQWAEVIFPISALTRVGNDQTLTLQNTSKMQWLFNMSGSATVLIGAATIFGGSAPDVGNSGAPYLYRVRPRSSVTGVRGNPSPATRYGVNPRRAPVLLSLPSAIYDAQIDTWDIFRYGGTVTSWRKIGQCASSASTFTDNFTDEAAFEGEELEFDNLQPWPSVDAPLNATATAVTGFIATVSIPTPNFFSPNLYLPGNLVRLGGINVYTLRSRPIATGVGVYQFEFLENAGAQTNIPCQIYEPLAAHQFLPYMWGPDAAGTVFAVGDPARPGTLYFTKNYNPDSAPDAYNIEITPPSEPLLGGETLDGLSFVASSERWWALYPQPSNPAQRYSVVQQPMTRGLASPYGHCSDGKSIYWWAKDGIWSSSEGSLTDADLYNIFPHDGVPGETYSYSSFTVLPPDYSRAATFRLCYSNGYLYAVYQDSVGTAHNLTLDIRRGAWTYDVYVAPPSVFYHTEQPEGTLLATSANANYPILLMGGQLGGVYEASPLSDDSGVGITATYCTFEWDGGDLRAGEQWGDAYLDLVPQSPTVNVTPMFGGAPASPTVSITQSSARTFTPISLGGGILTPFLGLQITWVDDFTAQPGATILHAWQPSYLDKPETIADRFTDWYDGGTEAAKYVQGFLLHADTDGNVKGLQVRDGDTQSLHAFTPVVNHNGESIIAYSFNPPFVAHNMRIEPTDQVAWRFFDVDWVFEETPETAETWQTQGTSFGANGFSHIQRIVAAYASASPVTLTITAFDGTSPAPIALPATGGAYQKSLQMLTPNKGQLYTFAAQSATPFQFYLEDFEILVGPWGRSNAYTTWKSLGGKHGVEAAI